MTDNASPNHLADDPGDANFDQELRRVLHGIDVPAGLRESLLARTQQAYASELGNAPELSTDFKLDDVGKAATTAASGSTGADENLRSTTLSGKRARQRVGWRAMLACSMVGTAAVILISVFNWKRPVTDDDLIEFCLNQMNQHVQADDWIKDAEVDFFEQLVSYRPARQARLIGRRKLESGRVGSGHVWKLHSNKGPFFVFDIAASVPSSSLDRRLRKILVESGGWSLAACQLESRILVVAWMGGIKLESGSLVLVGQPNIAQEV